MVDKEYEICKKACKEVGCYCPPDHIFHIERANCHLFLRFYYMEKGRIEKCVNNANGEK